jgi:hypothetical protein
MEVLVPASVRTSTILIDGFVVFLSPPGKCQDSLSNRQRPLPTKSVNNHQLSYRPTLLHIGSVVKNPITFISLIKIGIRNLFVCVCVCVCEREREREIGRACKTERTCMKETETAFAFVCVCVKQSEREGVRERGGERKRAVVW